MPVRGLIASFGLLCAAACSSTPQRLSGEPLHAPYPYRCFDIDTSPAALERCGTWVERELGMMIGDGYCGTSAWGAFSTLVEMGPEVHACLVHQLEHSTSPQIADNALAVLMATGCEGSMLTWCEAHGEQERCEKAHRWQRDSLDYFLPPIWPTARLRVNEHPSASAIVRVVQSDTGNIFYADTPPNGAFAIPFAAPGRYRVTVYLNGNSDEEAAPSFDLVMDDGPGDFRTIKRFGNRVIELVGRPPRP